ncbi:ADP-ribosylglycohydrolase family protein [Nocardia sp. FBN12]|uniref:ADP-ribosylglycohydrolase family protein n=1 Tax=Nocardia sp. FBN12 TaxID=3419766 RepID=UPI003D02FF8E
MKRAVRQTNCCRLSSRTWSMGSPPFTLWVAATYLEDYPRAVTACVEAGGDVDTTAAIVGGIVAAHTGAGDCGSVHGVPREWLDACESLPAWAFERSAGNER